MKWIPWVLKLLWDPVETLDLVDGEGRADHSKILPALCLLWLLILATLNRLPPIMWGVVLVSASYGYGAWRTFLMSKSVTRHESLIETVRRTIPANETDIRRDDESDPANAGQA